MREVVGKYYVSFAVQPWLLNHVNSVITISNKKKKKYIVSSARIRVQRAFIARINKLNDWIYQIKPSVLQLILRLRDTGIANYHLQDVIRRRASLNVREVLIEHDVNTDAARVLGLTPLGAGFAVFINGLLISIIVFYLELRQLRPHWGYLFFIIRIIQWEFKGLLRLVLEVIISQTRYSLDDIIHVSPSANAASVAL